VRAAGKANKRDERRGQILDALYDVIATRGAHGASVSEIAEQAGIARGALHYFFDSKAEITVELMRRLGARYLTDVDAYLDRRRARRSRSLVGDLAAWHFVGDAHEATRRLTVWIDFWGQAASDESIRDVVFEVQAGARRAVEKAMLLDRPHTGRLDDATRDGHAAAILALIEGGLLQWRFAHARDTTLSRDRIRASIEAAARAVLDAIPTGGKPATASILPLRDPLREVPR
jgi:AcrR family transcriptional regulator